MVVNPKHPISQALRKVGYAVVICGLCGYSLFTFLGPQPPRQLELPGVTVSQADLASMTTCVDGVSYLTRLGNPVTALLDAQGLAIGCRGEQNAGFEQFGVRYRTYCINRIQVVRLIEHRRDSTFVRYNPDTGRPLACDSVSSDI